MARDALDHDHPFVRTQALRVLLDRMSTFEARDLAATAVHDEDFGCRIIAVSALLQMGDQRYEAMRRTLEADLADPRIDPGVKWQIELLLEQVWMYMTSPRLQWIDRLRREQDFYPLGTLAQIQSVTHRARVSEALDAQVSDRHAIVEHHPKFTLGG